MRNLENSSMHNNSFEIVKIRVEVTKMLVLVVVGEVPLLLRKFATCMLCERISQNPINSVWKQKLKSYP
jgi:hypothetical protein